MPWAKAWAIIWVVGSEKGSVLYWSLKVAVPQMRGGRTVESGGREGRGIFAMVMM